MKITESQFKKRNDKKYNLVGNCVNGLDDPYFRRTVCYDATEMAGIVDEYSNEFLLADDFIQSVNWPHDLMGLPSDNIYEFAYNPYKDIYWAYNIEDDVHFFFVKDSINENYRDTITVKTIKLSDILEGMLSEPEGKYVYIGTCMNSFDEYGECIHDAFYDEEHFFNSWENADKISKEEFWSNINPSSDKYNEVKELESDPEYPAEYRYNPDDDVYFIFVSDDTHYFFVSPNSYENIKDNEENSYDMKLQENINRIKSIMNIKEDDSQMVLQQATDEFNEKAEEDLTPDEFQEVVCTNPDTVEVPNTTPEQKQKVEEFKAKLKTASIEELKQVKRQLKDLRRQKQQNEQTGAMVTLLGVTMPHTFALVIGGILLIMVLNILLKIFNIHLVKTVTSWCTGRQTTGYGIRFGRN